MIPLTLKVYLTLSALLTSTLASVAADCADDPNECTLKKLCEAATASDGNNIIWSTEPDATQQVNIAQSLRMKCGVTPLVDLCDQAPPLWLCCTNRVKDVLPLSPDALSLQVP